MEASGNSGPTAAYFVALLIGLGVMTYLARGPGFIARYRFTCQLLAIWFALDSVVM
jgi:hypothetical protein